MKQDKQSNTYNNVVQSIGIAITPIGYGSWETQDEMKQIVYLCTISPSLYFTKKTIAQFPKPVFQFFKNWLSKDTPNLPLKWYL